MNSEGKLSPRDKVLEHLKSLGAGPKRSLGQNFLVSETVISKIIDAAEPEKFQKTIEIGPGLGALTEALLERSSNLQLIELDRKFAKYWQDQRQCQVLQVDALKAPWSELIDPKTLLVSNLPYQISSRLLVEMTIANPSPDRLVLMFQKEVAQRIQAQEKDGDYSFLSVIVQTFWQSRTLLEAGAVDFFPKPNVASRVLVFDRKRSFDREEQKAYLSFLKLCFEQKKKILFNRLKTRYDMIALETAFESQGIEAKVRVGQLGPGALFRLFQGLTGLFS